MKSLIIVGKISHIMKTLNELMEEYGQITIKELLEVNNGMD